jgi:uncharacterized protein GlcG (DUF336 family)
MHYAMLVDAFSCAAQLVAIGVIAYGAFLLRPSPLGNYRSVLFAIAIATSFNGAQAQDVRNERNLSLALAQEAAAEALAACSRNGYNTAVAVVDRAGHVRVVLRADAAGPHTVETARRKAFTSAATRINSGTLMELAQKNPASANLVHIPDFMLLGGGVPIRAANEVIGAIGVSGAPGGHLDDQCADVGIARIKDRLN